MSTKKYQNVKDEFIQKFTSHDEFISFVKEWCEDTEFISCPAKDISFVPLASLTPDQIAGGEEAFRDSMRMDGFKVAAVLPNYPKMVAMRPYIYKDVKQHHRDNAAVLGDMFRAEHFGSWCEHINNGRSYLKKELLVMLRGDKASGWSSEFNNSRDESEQIQFLETALRSRFPAAEFLSGEVSHYYTMAKYALDVSVAAFTSQASIASSVVQAYEDAWVSAGGDVNDLRTAVPVATFVTGESGLSAISLSAGLEFADKTFIPLGKALTVSHRGSDEKVWGKFEAMPDNIAVLYQKGLTGLANLSNRIIYHPWSCVTHICKLFRGATSVKVLTELMDSFEEVYPPDDPNSTCYAIDIFNELNETLATAVSEQGPIKRLRNTEILAQLVTMDWDAFDRAAPEIFGKRSGSANAAARTDPDWFSDF